MSILANLKAGLRPTDGYDVDAQIIDSIAATIRKNAEEFSSLKWNDPTYWPGPRVDPSEVSQYFAVGNSVNFRYWFFDPRSRLDYCAGKKGSIASNGAHYMWRCLKVCLERESFPILGARYLARINVRDVRMIFADDEGHNRMPDLGDRVSNLRDLGQQLMSKWDGRFSNLVAASSSSLNKITNFSAELRAFDVHFASS